jgi:prepilin-type processing-associated H-X9-DG protein
VLNDYTAADPRARNPAPAAAATGPDGEPLFEVPRNRRIDSFANPAATILAFEASDLSFLIGDHRTHPDTWFFGWSNVLADIDPYRHRGSANYLFADLHVERLAGAKLKARVDAGDNPAVPPP